MVPLGERTTVDTVPSLGVDSHAESCPESQTHQYLAGVSVRGDALSCT